MAEDKTPETPETVVEEVENAAATGETAPVGAADESAAGAAAAADETTATEGGDAVPPKPAPPPAQTRRDRLEARRAARRPAQRGPVTPEQREEERRARRAETAKQRRAYRAKLKQRRAATRTERPAPAPAHAAEHGPGRPRVRQGVVTSAKGDKTITVKIDVVRRHRRYHKIMRSTLKLYAHDEANNANEGDTVRVVECRPMSATKRWRLTEVLERAK
jgi:small subunit ribosomal protein S17